MWPSPGSSHKQRFRSGYPSPRIEIISGGHDCILGGGHLQLRHQVVPQNPIIYQETAVRAAPPEPQATGGGEAAARWMVRDVFFQEKWIY